MTFDFETDYLIEKLKELKPKKVLVQLPEGIKQNAFDVEKTFKDLGIEVVFSGQTCWGGCGVAVFEAQQVGADLIVHFGHAKFIDVDFPVLYIEIKDKLNLLPLLKKSLNELSDFKKIGLSYSIQHRHDLEKITGFYKEEGNKEVILSKKIGCVAYEGHIVGCQYEGLKAIQDEVECFVIIGNNFHSMGAAIALEKPVFLIDVYNDSVKKMENVREEILKQRYASIEKFKEAENIGIITELKPGQQFGSAKDLVKRIEKKGKKVIVITMDEMTPDKLMNFYNIDCFVELACPRIAVDDFAKYEKPIITYKEALVGLGEMSWDKFLETGAV